MARLAGLDGDSPFGRAVFPVVGRDGTRSRRDDDLVVLDDPDAVDRYFAAQGRAA